MFVKICGVTTVDDALLAAGLGADAIGMIFASSARRVAEGNARDIVRRVPPEVLSVGVFRNERRERVVELANRIGLRAVQLHGDETAEDTRWIGERVPAVIKAFSIEDPALESGADYGPHRLLIDSPVPGSGRPFDWDRLDRRVAGRPYLLAGGLNPDNVGRAIELLGPWGVDVASGVEASPGRKDPSKVRRFLAAARAAVPRPRPAEPVPASGRPAYRDWHPGSSPVPVDAGAGPSDDRRPFDWEEDRT
jgi:phosphoribosylanthranilate isomerase